MIRAIVFDADHTLYTPTSDRAYEEKFRFLAEETGIPVDELEAAWMAALASVEHSAHPDDRERRACIRDMLARAGADVDDDLVAEAHDLFYDAVVDDMEYEDEVTGLLDRLQERYAVLAVATDEFPDALGKKLSAVFPDHEELFDAVVTPDETGIMKPATQFYTRILEAHDLEPAETVMVGDSWKRDLAPAKALGMATVLVGDDAGDPDVRIDSILDLEGALEGL